jgi:hypothetical protein
MEVSSQLHTPTALQRGKFAPVGIRHGLRPGEGNSPLVAFHCPERDIPALRKNRDCVDAIPEEVGYHGQSIYPLQNLSSEATETSVGRCS